MFFQGSFAGAGLSLPNIQSDIIGILTGTITSFAGLSSSFSSGVFINTTPPGWSMYDSNAGTPANGVTPKVIQAPHNDAGSMFKNMYIFSISATQLAFNGYETWNSGAHTGTNPMVAAPAASTWQCLTPAINNLVTIAATADFFYIAMGVNDTTPTTTLIAAEYSRDDPWNTVSNGYPSWAQLGQFGASLLAATSNGAITRAYNSGTVTDVTTIIFGQSATAPWAITVPDCASTYSGTSLIVSSGGAGIGGQVSLMQSLLQVTGSDSGKAASRYLYSMGVRQGLASNNPLYVAPWLGGSISTRSNMMYFLGNTAATGGDTITVGADTYYVAQVNGFPTVRIAIKKT